MDASTSTSATDAGHGMPTQDWCVMTISGGRQQSRYVSYEATGTCAANGEGG